MTKNIKHGELESLLRAVDDVIFDKKTGGLTIVKDGKNYSVRGSADILEIENSGNNIGVIYVSFVESGQKLPLIERKIFGLQGAWLYVNKKIAEMFNHEKRDY